MPSSRLKVEIARLLKEEGYIRDFRIVSSEEFNERRGQEEAAPLRHARRSSSSSAATASA